MIMAGKVITFYAYKGGVGRSQALANVAVSLANRGKRVIAVDMDLESPGIHAFFQPPGRPTAFAEDDFTDQDGLLEFLIACSHLPEKRPDVRALLRACSHPRLVDGSIRLLPAGKLDAKYGDRLQWFSWASFYKHAHGAAYVDMIRSDLAEDADYVLIDSRTGMTDASYVGTYQLAEVVVVLFALHRQGIAGAGRIARGIRACREDEAAAARPRRTLLVASRVDESGEEEALQEWTARARSELSGLSDELLIAPEDRLPYMAAAAFGERIVVGGESASHLSLAYDRLVQRLLDGIPDPGAVHREEPIRGPSDLFTRARSLSVRAERLANEIVSARPSEMNVRGLATWAYEIARDRAEIETQAHRLWSETHQLAATPAGDPAIHAEDASGLRELSKGFLNVVREAATAWTRMKLTALAGGDEALLGRAIALTAEAVELLDASLFEDALARAKSLLLAEGIDALLHRNALESDRIGRLFGDADACSKWLETRLQELLGDPDFDERLRAVLHNLLRLLAGTMERAEPHHWLAYDYLCLFCSENEHLQQAAFETVGVALWRAEWRAVFDSASPGGSPTAPEAIKVLQQLLTHAATRELVLWIEAMLLGRCEQDRGPVALEAIFRALGDAPLLIAAIDRIAKGHSPHRRGVLGTWLSVVGPEHASVDAICGFIGALVFDAYTAEAHYALDALSRERSDISDTPEAAAATLGVLVNAIEHARVDVVATLWASEAAAERVLSTRAGKAIAAAYMTNIVSFPATSMALGAMLARHPKMADPPLLPTSVETLSWSDMAPDAGALALKIRELLKELEEHGQKRFHARWGDAAIYERAFKSWLEEKVKTLMASTAPAATVRSELERMDPHEWIDHTYATQRERIASLRRPDGVATDGIIRTFNLVRTALIELNALRTLGPASLASLRDESDRLGTARKELITWSRQAPDQLPPWLANAVQRLLGGIHHES